ncbi:MAG: outer membrane protein assembly factor BamD [Paracoccaceae bacterium]
MRIFFLMMSLILFGLIACGPKPPAETAEAKSAQTLYQNAEYVLEVDKNRTKAVALFAEVVRLYPYSEWTKRALIMLAYVKHKDRKYDEARAASQRFLHFYPDDEEAPYAMYLVALSYYDQIDDIGRDQALTREALWALRDVFEEYPNSDYARAALLKFDLAFDHLAAKQMEVGRYYLKRGHYTAAINRFRAVVESYQSTVYTAEALHRLVESYMALGLKAEAQTAGAILGYNYQSSPFYQDTYNLLTNRGLKPEASGRGWLRVIYRQVIKGEWL